MVKSIAVIPARYGSSRLPGKPLADVCGKALLERVWESVSRSSLLQRIVIATDDERIFDLCMNIGAECVMTPSELPSGTDRVLNAYDALREDAEIVVNVQGDEPFLGGELIDKLIVNFIESKADVGTIVKKITDIGELLDPNAVKAVIKQDSTAMYFSRSPVPFARDIAPEELLSTIEYRKHIGVYAYKIESLRIFAETPPSVLEQTEKLEQLRLMEAGAKYYCMETDKSLIGVDTPEDLERVRGMFGSSM